MNNITASNVGLMTPKRNGWKSQLWFPIESPCRVEHPLGEDSSADISTPHDEQHWPLGIGLPCCGPLEKDVFNTPGCLLFPFVLVTVPGDQPALEQWLWRWKKTGRQSDRCLDQHQGHLFRNTVIVFEIYIFWNLDCFLKSIYLFLCVWTFACLSVCTICVHCLQKPEDGITDPELELWIVMGCHVGVGSWVQVLCKSSQCP